MRVRETSGRQVRCARRDCDACSFKMRCCLNALAAGKYPGVRDKHALHIEAFTKPLLDARNHAVSDLQHKLPDPEDALSWWARHSREIQLATVIAVVAAIVSAIVAWIVASLGASSGP